MDASTNIYILKEFKTPFFNLKYGDIITISYLADRFNKNVDILINEIENGHYNDWFKVSKTVSDEQIRKNHKINHIINIISETKIKGIDLNCFKGDFYHTAEKIYNIFN